MSDKEDISDDINNSSSNLESEEQISKSDDVSRSSLVDENDTAENSISDDDDHHDDDDDDDDDEDEIEKYSGRQAKKAKRTQFIETEAEVDEEEDEEEYDEDEDLDFIDEANEAEALQPQIYDKVDRRREQSLAEDEDVDAIMERYREKYGRGVYSRAEAAEFRGDADQVPMQFLLPTNKDPNLWLVKCKPGKEMDIALNMQRKFLHHQEIDDTLPIYSVVTRSTLRGYVYVEAKSSKHVQDAIDQMNNLYITKISLVPLNEMVDVLRAKPKRSTLKIGSWSRIKHGKYKGDLAQIMEVSENNLTCVVKLIPRIDYSKEIREKKRKIRLRPQQRFFNPKDIPRRSDKSLTRNQRGLWVWGNDSFDRDGFLIKTIRVRGLVTDDISPKLDEISKFNAATGDITASGTRDAIKQNIDLSSLDAGSGASSNISKISPGDLVTVKEGELVNAQGRVKSIAQNYVVVSMKDSELGDVHIEPEKLAKTFQVGDRVRVVRGKYEGVIGMVTQVSDNTVSVFSDVIMDQFSVFSKDLQSAVDNVAGDMKTSDYKVHDFIQFGAGNVGVIIAVENDHFKIIDQYGVVKLIKAQEITQKRETKGMTTLDAYQKSISVGDTVELMAGEHFGKSFSVLHIYKTWVFLYSKEIADTNGIYVTRSRLVASLSSKFSNGSSNQYSFGASPASRQSRNQRYPPNSRRNMALLHKVIFIRTGPFKGYQGMVKSITDKGLRVELNTNGKIVTVPESGVALPDDNARRPDLPRPDNRGSFAGSRTAWGSRTPSVYGSQTPAAFSGAQTPALFTGGQTPAWDAGSKTPAWDAGSKTPAWDAGSRTPGFASATHGRQDASVSRAREQSTSRVSLPWLLPNVEVTVVSGPQKGQCGHIESIFDEGRVGVLVFADKGRSSAPPLKIPSQFLEPIRPQKKEPCVVIEEGDKKGLEGVLINLDGQEAIMKDSSGTFASLSLSGLCKLKA